MDIYEQIYQRLYASGEPAWTGSGYPRAWHNLHENLTTLKDAALLPAPGSRILELGCGNGSMASLWFAREGYQVSGVDISPTAIRWAQENFFRQGLCGDFQTADVCHLNQLPEHPFALIFDGSCMHCLTGKQREQAWHEIKRLLAVDGHFVLSSMCGEPRKEEDRRHYNPAEYVLYRDGQPWRTLLPLPLLRQEILEQGFSIQHQQVTNNPWWDHVTLCVVAR